MEKDKFEFIERYDFYRWNNLNYGLSLDDGFGEQLYFIMYFDEKGNITMDEVYANSDVEAVGHFLVEHNKMCYADVLDVMLEDEYYERYM